MTFVRAFSVACACLFVLPRSAVGAEPSLAIDFDGDGRHDHVMLDRREPSVLHVWLSASETTQAIHAGVPLVRVIATDLDGDHRPELIARDSEFRIHVWTPGHKGFRSYRPRAAVPGTPKQPDRRSVDDNDTEPADVITSVTFAVALSPSRAEPAVAAVSACAHHLSPACRSFMAADPFAPRPPPPFA